MLYKYFLYQLMNTYRMHALLRGALQLLLESFLAGGIGPALPQLDLASLLCFYNTAKYVLKIDCHLCLFVPDSSSPSSIIHGNGQLHCARTFVAVIQLEYYG
jgi:hypothetical protein